MAFSSKVLFTIILIFFATQVIGLYTGITVIDITSRNPELENSFNVAPAPRGDMVNTGIFFLGVVLGAVFMIFFIKWYKGKFLFKVLEFVIVSSGTSTVFFSFFIPFNVGIDYAFVLGISLGLLFAIVRFLREETIIRNSAAVLASAGIGAMFGYSIGLFPAIVLSIALAFYDIFAVFIAKYMVTFAKHFSAKNLSFSVVASAGKEKEITVPIKEAKDYGMNITQKDVKRGKVEIKTKEFHLELGTGDLVIPLVLSVSAYPVFGLIGSIMIILAGLAGLTVVLKEVTQKHNFQPALPYIVTPCLIVITILFMLT